MAALVTFARFRQLTLLPSSRVDELERVSPGFVDGHLELRSRALEDRLRHKYAIPLPTGHATIDGWIVAEVQRFAAVKIGIDPSDLLFEEIRAAAELAEEQIKDASDPKSERWNIPLVTARDGSAIAKNAPLGYSEASPWAWTDEQLEALRG